MRSTYGIILAACFAFVTAQPADAEGKVAIVAAENFYGDLAKQIGGDHVSVASIMSNPDQDPFSRPLPAPYARSPPRRSSTRTAPTMTRGWTRFLLLPRILTAR